MMILMISRFAKRARWILAAALMMGAAKAMAFSVAPEFYIDVTGPRGAAQLPEQGLLRADVVRLMESAGINATDGVAHVQARMVILGIPAGDEVALSITSSAVRVRDGQILCVANNISVLPDMQYGYRRAVEVAFGHFLSSCRHSLR